MESSLPRPSTAFSLTKLRAPSAQEVDLPSIKSDRSPAPSVADLEQRRNEKIERYSEVIERLKTRLYEYEQSEANRQRNGQPTETIPEISHDQTHPEAADQEPGNLPDSDQRFTVEVPPVPEVNMRGNPPTDEDVPPDPEPGSGGAESTESADLRLPDDVLVEDAVDRVALADNLYAIGEYSLAKDVYEQVNMVELTPDQQFWVQFQNASCLRQVGDMKAAKKQLLILAGQSEAKWLASSSRWWLDMIDDRAELEQRIAATQSRLDSAGKNIDATTRR